ncbi:DUF87 domain-containing protein [Patescibacteria group bacterium]|jgi:S-DNA-T family DNA segregation ATPase FtsK/SpoIIIE|nr:DUF87 domain-containing protein [Patescibacteria group bacterium]
MAKRTNKKEPRPGLFDELKPETSRTVLAILYLLVAIVLLASAFRGAGMLGEYVRGGLTYVFGVGFYLLPLLFIGLSAQKFRPRPEGETTSTKRLKQISTIALTVLALILLDIPTEDAGGLVGGLMADPLVALMGVWVALVVVAGLMAVALIILFETHLNLNLRSPFGLIKKRDAPQQEEMTERSYLEEIEDGDEPADEPAEEPEEDEDPEEGGAHEDEPAPQSPRARNSGEESGIVMTPAAESAYTPPPLSLLSRDKRKPEVGDTKANANIIKRTLANFGITVEMDEITVGPTVTRYALKPAEGVRISRIVGLQGNLELALSGATIRIEAPIPGKSLIGIEVPNQDRATIGLHYLLNDPAFSESSHPLLAALGRDITGTPHYIDIAKMPHGLIAGTTGSGKSVVLHSILTSLLYRRGPSELRLMIIDPKRTEFSAYDGIPHMITPVITEPKKAIIALKWAVQEMDRRNEILQAERERNIADYHQNVLAPARAEQEKRRARGEEVDPAELPEPLPYIVIAIDEMADLMTTFPRELESSIYRLAQVGRAAGVHLVLATQRPSVNVITGTIKANIPTRIALNVASQVDSRTILDAAGAEKLLGRGDMLYQGSDSSKPQRLQSAFISGEELSAVVSHLKKHNDPTLHETIDLAESGITVGEGGRGGGGGAGGDGDDPMYEEAKAVVIQSQRAATSFLQRKLGVGYGRAAKIMDLLEERGVIGPGAGAKPREVLISADSAGGGDAAGDEVEGDDAGEAGEEQAEEEQERA